MKRTMLRMGDILEIDKPTQFNIYIDGDNWCKDFNITIYPHETVKDIYNICVEANRDGVVSFFDAEDLGIYEDDFYDENSYAEALDEAYADIECGSKYYIIGNGFAIQIIDEYNWTDIREVEDD